MCLLLCLPTVWAQNLVPNGNFEDGDCPTTYAAINDLDHWYFGIQLPDVEWNLWPSPDWWHTCSPFEELQPPNVSAGYQTPLSGGGMAGVLTYVDIGSDKREILSIELLENLEIGATYTFSFSAARAVAPGIGGSTNRLGMKLTTFPFWTTHEGPLTNSAHFSVEEVLEDSTNWTTLTTEIIADSAYRYLHLGNFYDDDHTTIVTYDDLMVLRPYYFLDEVSLVKESLTTVGRDFISDNLRVFPNPATDFIKIKSRKRITEIQVFGLEGQMVFERKLNREEEVEVDISAWSSGLYILTAKGGKGAIHHSKFIKN